MLKYRTQGDFYPKKWQNFHLLANAAGGSCRKKRFQALEVGWAAVGGSTRCSSIIQFLPFVSSFFITPQQCLVSFGHSPIFEVEISRKGLQKFNQIFLLLPLSNFIQIQMIFANNKFCACYSSSASFIICLNWKQLLTRCQNNSNYNNQNNNNL